MGWQWKQEVKGQYVDGHERNVDGHEHNDVVTYCQDVFLPGWSHLQPHMRHWVVDPKDNNAVIEDAGGPQMGLAQCHTVMWFHDESTFHANDQ